MSSILVQTLTGASYNFDIGSSTTQIRQRIKRNDVEAKSLNLQDSEMTFYSASSKQAISDTNNIMTEGLIQAQFTRYPSVVRLFSSDMWYFSILWGVIGAFWIAMWAQASFNSPKWWSDAIDSSTSIPITFQTFAIMVLGMLTGWKASLIAGILYYLMVAAGAPFAAQSNGGWEVIAYGSGGYFIGFIVALFQLGWMAEKGWDRVLWRTLCMMGIANIIIYIFGLIWLPFGLALKYDMKAKDLVCGTKHGCVGQVFMWGLVPFIPGDIIKITLATIVCNIVWKSVGCYSTNHKYDQINVMHTRTNDSNAGQEDDDENL